MTIEAMKLALEALEKALDAIESWGSYASGYFQVKHDWEGDIENTKASITALRQAIEQAQRNEFNPDWNLLEATQESLREHMAEIQRLRGLLEQIQPSAYSNTHQQSTEQEPVAWITQGGKGWLRWHKSYDDNKDSVPLYTTPPQRKPLTDEQLMIEMVDAAMVATKNIVPRITRSQCETIIKATHNITGENT